VWVRKTLERTSWIIVPVVPQFLLAFAVRPDLIIPVEHGSPLHLFLTDVGPVALKILGIGELVPRNGAMVNTNAEEAAKRYVYVEDFATHLLDQQPLDRADLPAQLVEHCRAFDAVALDHRMKWCGLVACPQTRKPFSRIPAETMARPTLKVHGSSGLTCCTTVQGPLSAGSFSPVEVSVKPHKFGSAADRNTKQVFIGVSHQRGSTVLS
jgi:hypothetical protein